MKLYRATYSLADLDGHVKVDEQWVFFEAEDRSDALEKIPDLLKAMWECCGFQLEVWNLYDESDLVMLSMDMVTGASLRLAIPVIQLSIWMLIVMAGRCFLFPRQILPV